MIRDFIGGKKRLQAQTTGGLDRVLWVGSYVVLNSAHVNLLVAYIYFTCSLMKFTML